MNISPKARELMMDGARVTDVCLFPILHLMDKDGEVLATGVRARDGVCDIQPHHEGEVASFTLGGAVAGVFITGTVGRYIKDGVDIAMSETTVRPDQTYTFVFSHSEPDQPAPLWTWIKDKVKRWIQ